MVEGYFLQNPASQCKNGACADDSDFESLGFRIRLLTILQ